MAESEKPTSADRAAIIALNHAEGISRDQACSLAATMHLWRSVDRLDLAAETALAEVRLTPSALERARSIVSDALPRARVEEERAAGLGARIVTIVDAEYPASLFHLSRPPPTLYVRGLLPEAPAVALVGPRSADRFALEATRQLAGALSRAGLVVVSGFARGVDATAHRSALDTPGGLTVAVLGCGLGVPYPQQHHTMADEIAEAGAVISEFPVGRPPDRWSFPIRNRIIAALAEATVVIQASARSGALITAREANELGREVMALPGRIEDVRCRGSNRLLRDGAQIVLDPDDVIGALPRAVRDRLVAATAAATEPLTSNSNAPQPARLLSHLDVELTADRLAELAQTPICETLSELARLELDGLVSSNGAFWRRC